MSTITSIILTSFLLNQEPHPSPEQFREELGIQIISSEKENPPPNACNLYLIQHGSTDWSAIKRLQGWGDVSLNKAGKEEIKKIAEKIEPVFISAIYSSSLRNAEESSMILQEKLSCPLYLEDNLRGEFHGNFEGYTKEQYEKEPHFQIYYTLPPADELFYPCGKNGESKADVARRAIPSLKEIAAKHPGENVVIVSHGGLSKLFNFYLGNYSEELGTVSIPHGEYMRLAANDSTIFLYTARD